MAEGMSSIEPLSFGLACNTTPSSSHMTQCVLCNATYDLTPGIAYDPFLHHLLGQHKLVIGDVNLIADFRRYVNYWRVQLSQHPITDYCSVIRTNTGRHDIEPSEDYYLLSDIINEDKKLREILQREKLESILRCQHVERQDQSLVKPCLFCKLYGGAKNELFEHMSEEHGFNIGQPDNIVYAEELLDVLHEQLKSCKCLYCEKIFKDRMTLKEHMRKKNHKRLNPKNKKYDKYYIINYLELGKNWEHFQKEDDTLLDSDTDKDDDWSDWQEMGGAKAVCLFCDWSAGVVDMLWQHMKKVHDFDMEVIRSQLQLTFYQQIKLVNFIRRQVHNSQCVNCDEKFRSRGELLRHMSDKNHINTLPDTSNWDQPQYFFPTYEDDNLLYALEDDDITAGSHSNSDVIAENRDIRDSVFHEDRLLQDVKNEAE